MVTTRSSGKTSDQGDGVRSPESGFSLAPNKKRKSESTTNGQHSKLQPKGKMVHAEGQNSESFIDSNFPHNKSEDVIHKKRKTALSGLLAGTSMSELCVVVPSTSIETADRVVGNSSRRSTSSRSKHTSIRRLTESCVASRSFDSEMEIKDKQPSAPAPPNHGTEKSMFSY